MFDCSARDDLDEGVINFTAVAAVYDTVVADGTTFDGPVIEGPDGGQRTNL